MLDPVLVDHVNLISKKVDSCVGIDKSSAMVDYAKNKYQKCEFIQGDATVSIKFTPNSFTHITCLYFHYL